MKKIIITVLFLLFIFPISHISKIVNAESNSTVYGTYSPKNESIIKELFIDRNRFQIILNTHTDDLKLDENYKRIMEFKNYFKNNDALRATIDTDKESENSSVSDRKNEERIVIEFYEKAAFPTFAISIYNPTYELENNKLTIHYAISQTWSFEWNDMDNTLTDNDNFIYTKNE